MFIGEAGRHECCGCVCEYPCLHMFVSLFCFLVFYFFGLQQYRQMRRREQDRLARMDADYQRRKELAEFTMRREERMKAAEEQTEKKRLKRQRKKQRKKEKKMKPNADGEECRREDDEDSDDDGDETGN